MPQQARNNSSSGGSSNGGSSNISTLHLAVLGLGAAILGLSAGAAAVLWVLRREEEARYRRTESDDGDSGPIGNDDDAPPGSSSTTEVPLFDSVHKWLRSNSAEHSSSNSCSAKSNRYNRQSKLSPHSISASVAHENDHQQCMPRTEWEMDEAEIKICKRPDGTLWHLGAGSYGQVFKAIRNETQAVAVKVFPSNATDMQMADFQKEIVILKSCRDRNIVQFLGACITETQTCLVTEYMERGDLYNALHRDAESQMLTWYRRSTTARAPGSKRTPTAGLGRKIALDIAKGLHFLHTHRIVHMDVKSPNVLLGRDHNAKLADVGLAKLLHKDYLSAAKSVGTFAWSAPEVLMGGRCSEKVDIFSFGVVLWEIVTGESPSRGRLRQVRVPDECSEAVAHLITACMDAEPSSRPSAMEIVNMLDATGNEKALQSAASRRKEKHTEVGPGAGKVMDELLRHAGLLGIKDYTHSDALLAAHYEDDFRLYHRYVSEVRACMDDEKPPRTDSLQFKRLIELVHSFRSLLSTFLSEYTDTVMELRNVNMTKCKQQKGSKAQIIDDVASDKTTLGTREEVNWRPALEIMQLTPEQAAAVMEARSAVVNKVEELTQQRKQLIADLQTSALRGHGSSFMSAVQMTEQLRANMAKEGNVRHEYHFWFFCAMLTPIQEACVEMKCHPFFPDSLALSDLIVKDAVNALGNAKCTS